MSNSTGVTITAENQTEILELAQKAMDEADGKITPPKEEQPPKSEEKPTEESKSASESKPTDEAKSDDKAKGLEIEKKDPASEEKQAPAKITMDSLAEEFTSNNGQLSPETTDKLVKALEAAGLDEPQAWISQFLEGRQVAGEAARSKMLADVGGEDGFKAMSTWAKENVSPEDIAAYNAAVKGSDMRLAKLAVDGMNARFKAANPSSKRIEAGANANAGGVEPISTTEQIAAITADPRYDRDPAWRAQMDRRIQAGIDAAKRKS